MILLCLSSIGPAQAGPMDDGEVLFLRGQYKSAIQSYQKALTYDINENSRAHCWYMLGQSYLLLGDIKQARAAFSTILERYAKTEWLPEAYVGLGDTYAHEGRHEQAIDNYKKAMSSAYLARSGSSAYYRIAKAYRALGQAGKAEPYENTIRKQYPDSLEARQLLLGKGAASPPASAAGPAGAQTYAVQVAYTPRADYARDAVAQYKKKGYDAYVDLVTANGANRYRVLIGRYQSREAADAMMRSFKAKEKSDAFVTAVGQ